MGDGRAKLRAWMRSHIRVTLTDGRTLVGTLVCTDREGNIILSACIEHNDGEEEARLLGLTMVPGKHIVSLCVSGQMSHDPLCHDLTV